jgi:twitching motility protein PilT
MHANVESILEPSKDTPAFGADPGDSLINVKSIEAAVPSFPTLEGAGEAAWREAMIALLRYASATGASDLHLSAESRPFVRRHRENEYLDSEPLSAEVAEGLNRALLTDAQWESFREHQDLDFALPFSSGERYRANLMVHKDGCAGTYRTIPREIRSFEDLGFRDINTIEKLLAYHNGLVIVAGPVGSGKTTTLASLVQHINRTREDHLISVEEPIEFVHRPDRCAITQRGVGEHTRTFQRALKGALRQDPDIIVIGEMRDLETVEMAISASETGHLVIGTMHTSDAATTLNRLLDVFPPAQQPQIRAMVAESLRGIICQRLLPAKDGGLVLACELLVRNTAVSSLVRDGKTQGLGNVMETGKADGMTTMDNSVIALWREGRLTDEVALANLKSQIAGREIRMPAPAVPEPEPKKRGFFNRNR